jgi:RimJ/RimL family protein N-acetyltransferase
MALNNEKIKTVIAETEIENISSQKVLERCGFKKYQEEKTMWWRFE